MRTRCGVNTTQKRHNSLRFIRIAGVPRHLFLNGDKFPAIKNPTVLPRWGFMFLDLTASSR
jgi:hypothetical protein